jgi:hypothetical protein
VTINSTSHISTYSIFSTENYTIKNIENNYEALQIYLSRFAQGQGILFKIDTIGDKHADISNNSYSAYSTYDQVLR